MAVGSRLEELLETNVGVLGYEVVDVEFGYRGRLLRVFIDKPEGITLEDCEAVSRQLQRVLPVEGVDYDRLEVSSPGLDRVLKKPADFRRFAGQEASVSLRIPMNGRRRFTGVLRGASDAGVDMEVDGQLLSFEFENVERARLVPRI